MLMVSLTGADSYSAFRTLKYTVFVPPSAEESVKPGAVS